MRKRKRNRLLVGFLVLAFIEVLLCLTGVLIPESWLASHKAYYEYYQPDDLLLYKVRPNLRDLTVSAPRDQVAATYSTDDQGFRNLGRDYSRAQIFFIGDSFVWGAWVTQEETLVSRIEAELGEPVINLGVGSYDFLRYLVLFEHFVARYKPRIAALGVFPNDLRDRSPLVPGKPGSGEQYYKGWSRYKTYPQYKKTLTYSLFRWITTGESLTSDQYGRRLDSDQKEASNGLTLFRYRGASRNYLENTQALNWVRTSVDRIVEISAQNDVKLAIFLFPTKESTYKSEYERLFPDSVDYLKNEEKGYQQILEWARSYGVLCLDLTPLFRELGKTMLLYYRLDPHWNPAGNDAAAKEVAQALRKPDRLVSTRAQENDDFTRFRLERVEN